MTMISSRAAEGPIRVAIVGCGAVSRQFHLPVLAGHEGVRLAALVDRDEARAAELAKAYGVPAVFSDARELSQKTVDAAIVATPPRYHAEACIDLARRGIHILVEKPMAITAADASAIVRAADDAGVVLAVGVFRRLLPSVRLLRAVLQSGKLGRPLRVDVEVGGAYTWPLATLSNLRKHEGGGGVLMDMGPHILDLLLFLFTGSAQVREYRDNARGGIETDCLLLLGLSADEHPVEASIELSRTRLLRNTIRVECDAGVAELPFGERDRVDIRPRGELNDDLIARRRACDLHIEWADERKAPGFEGFRAQVDDWLEAIRGGRPPLLSGASVLPTVQLIEDCYRVVQPLDEPWVDEGVNNKDRCETCDEGGRRLRADRALVLPTPPASRGQQQGLRRILITGATGFIGCRVAEILALRDGWQVRALVHNPSSAARLARLPVEMVVGDLRSREDVVRAAEGCDGVIHCAIGTTWRQRERVEVNVDGTRNLADAALSVGVQRFVHISSIAVHGTSVTGILDESTPVRPKKGDPYGQSKAEAERVIARAVRKGLPAVILRPGVVYGPFGPTVTIRPVQHLLAGSLVLVGCSDTPSNTVYVDNLVEAIIRALEAPGELVNGQVFAISDDDHFTWGEFFGYFAQAFGVQVRTISRDELRQLRPEPSGLSVVRVAESWYRGSVELAKSAEMRALLRRFLDTHPMGRAPLWFLDRFPGVPGMIRPLLGRDTPFVYRKADANGTQVPNDDLFTIDPIRARVSTDKATRVLGYAPAVSRPRAMHLSLDWLRYSRLVRSAGQAIGDSQ